jgi:hypothetical protein
VTDSDYQIKNFPGEKLPDFDSLVKVRPPAAIALTDLDKLRAEKESADFLGMTPRALQAWRQRGGGPLFVRISSRCIRYRIRDLIAWSESRLKTSTSE